MSATLSQLIQQEMFSEFGNEMVDNKKFADAMARAIQTYLNSSVLTIPLPTGPGSGPVTHIHPNVPHTLNAS